jgi:DNA repair exonuclease SbcCD ATPase subunit
MGINIMREDQEDNVQFSMRLDEEIEEAVIANDVDDLRIEKLNHRVTLISILIPVLIVVILGITYLDIKRRVVRTEDSGQLTAQTLSESLQSRFSTLSVGQAMIEENFLRLKDQTEQSIAKVQVNLKKLDETLEKSSKQMVRRQDMNTATAKLANSIDAMEQAVESVKQQLQALDLSFQQQLGALEQSVTDGAEQFSVLMGKLDQLEQNKIDKASLDLALKLEILKLKQAVNVRLDDTQSALTASQSEIKTLKRQIAALKAAQKAAAASRTVSPPSPSSPGGGLQEQTIKR